MLENALMVFDFDHTLLDVNSDVEIQKLLPGGSLTPALKTLSKEVEWNEFIRQVLVHLHETKVSEETLVEFLRQMPLTPGVPEMLTRLKELGCDIIIISDANLVFINEPLKASGLDHLVKTIFTNPASFNDNGLLSLQPFSNQTECNLCRRNMCKGSILRKYLSESPTSYSFVGYVGDGPNDFCPMLKLTSTDLAFPRKGYNIERVIQDKLNQGLTIQAEIVTWESVVSITEVVEKRLLSGRLIP